MNSGRYILSQVLDLVDRKTLSRLVERYDAESRVRHFGCRQQLICMALAQLTWREGLRDIATCLNAKPEALYHLGFCEPVAKSTLADANEQRDWRLWEDSAKSLMSKARDLYAGEDLGLELENTIYALDSTTIDLSLTLFPWADFRSTKAGIKLHTQIDLCGPIPTCIYITGARQHDLVATKPRKLVVRRLTGEWREWRVWERGSQNLASVRGRRLLFLATTASWSSLMRDRMICPTCTIMLQPTLDARRQLFVPGCPC